MAIIYSYPNELSIQATDILIGTTTKMVSGKRKNQTRNFSMEGISEFVINNIPRGTLTKANDTNVTLTLGGTPVDSLFNDVSITVGWTGLLADNRIASAAYWNAKQDSITLTTIGSTGAATFVADTLNIPDYSLSIPVITPSALTRVNDTNVTLTLGGTPNTSLLQGVSLTLGWSGTLADSRIASASTWNAKQNAITLTTLGTSGEATLVGSTLNIPQYTGGGASYTFTSPLVDTAGTVTINQSSSTVNGYLSSTDWGIFNGKQNALSGTGLVKSTSGTISYITDNSTNWDTAYTNRITSLTTTGTGAATLIANVLNIPTPPTAAFTSLTTSGSSGQSTLIGGVLNVPEYTLAGLGGVPTGRTLTINGTAYDLTADRTWSVGTITGVTATGPITSSGGSAPVISTSMATNKLIGRSTAGTGVMEEITIGTGLSLSAGTLSSANSGTVTSVGLTMPAAFTVSNSPITGAGTIAVTGAGTASQYIRGDGALATYNPGGGGGGGASVSYYLNGSVSQGTIGGVAYEEMNRVPVIGTGTDFTINADGYIAQFITDAGDPNKLLIPGGNWNFETYFSASSGGGSPSFYVELYKYDGTTFTLIASSSATPENITGGTSIDLYFTALAIPATTLLVTDRLAVRFYVTHSGRTITMHTENSHLCQVITTFSTGLTALNGLTAQVQNFATGTSGSDFNISSVTDTHTFNLPTASASNRGALSTTDWSTFNGKQNTITLTTTGTGAATFVSNTLNIPTPAAATTPTLDQVLTAGNTSLLNAKVGQLYLYDGANGDYGRITNNDSAFISYNYAGNIDFRFSSTDEVFTLYNSTNKPATFDVSGITASRNYTLPNATGTIALTSDLTGYVPTTRNISTTSPLQGGGDLSADRTLSILQSSASQDGYLSSTDWTAFNGKFTLPSLTSGSVLFSNGTTITQDNANFFWDDTNNRLGIGTTTPAVTLGVQNFSSTFAAHFSGNDKTNGVAIGTSSGNIATIQSITRTLSATTLLSINPSGGYVGIGNISPSQTLTVAGTAYITGAIYDSVNSPGTSGQVLSSTVTGTAWVASSGGIGGSGTTNTVPKFTGSTAIGDSNISDSGTLVTIATDSLINGITVGRGGGNINTNTAIGKNALSANTAGSFNTTIGTFSGFTLTGSQNIFVGAYAGSSATTANLSTVIGGFFDTTLNLFNQSETLSVLKEDAGLNNYTGEISGLPHIWAPETKLIANSSTDTLISLEPLLYSAIFIEYNLEDTNGSARAGSIKAVWNSDASTIKVTEEATDDIGSTIGCTIQLALSGGLLNVELDNTNGYDVYCNTTSRILIRPTIQTL